MRLLDNARKGDVVVVWKLDRLARSLLQLIDTAVLLNERGVELHSLTENIITTTPTGKLTFHLFAALAEFERDILRQRVNAGLAAARRRGRVGWRPKALNESDLKKARALLRSGEYTRVQVAAELKVGRHTLWACLLGGDRSLNSGSLCQIVLTALCQIMSKVTGRNQELLSVLIPLLIGASVDVCRHQRRQGALIPTEPESLRSLSFRPGQPGSLRAWPPPVGIGSPACRA